MFKNLFDYEERENVIEFVEEETIETVEELDTLLNKVKNIIKATVRLAVNGCVVTLGLVGLTAAVVTFPIVQTIKAVPVIIKEVNERRKARKAVKKIIKQLKKQIKENQ